MKKGFSIVLVLLFILSGMHISLATHYCGNEVSGLKWSFSEQKASCGMEETPLNGCHFPQLTAASCCKNEISVFSTDNNYSPSNNHTVSLSKIVIQELVLPGILSNITYKTVNLIQTDASPPGPLLASVVNLADICVFRI